MSRANYHECHVTIEPVLDEVKYQELVAIAEQHHFRVADLVMVKTEEKNRKDSFMTGRHMDINVLYERMIELVKALKQVGFKTYRYKIEKTILDSKHYDICSLLGPIEYKNNYASEENKEGA